MNNIVGCTYYWLIFKGYWYACHHNIGDLPFADSNWLLSTTIETTWIASAWLQHSEFSTVHG